MRLTNEAVLIVGNLGHLRTEMNNLDRLNREIKTLEKEVSKYDYDLQDLETTRNGIIKHNALLYQA